MQFHAQTGGILIAHKTHSQVKGTVLTEEQTAIVAKGFAKPVRTHKVVGVYDDLAAQGRIIRKEQDGLRILLDLARQEKITAIQALEDFVSESRGDNQAVDCPRRGGRRIRRRQNPGDHLRAQDD